jgi:hypothetical protein
MSAIKGRRIATVTICHIEIGMLECDKCTALCVCVSKIKSTRNIYIELAIAPNHQEAAKQCKSEFLF